MEKEIFKVVPFNFVPFTKTPWGGRAIAQLKKKYFIAHSAHIPDNIGESWEISTDAQFPSLVAQDDRTTKPLSALLAQYPQEILGASFFQKYGSHCPLLLKWLNALDNLSVQLHPNNRNPLLLPQECGKPESWLIAENFDDKGFIYLGFKAGLSREQIIKHLLNDELEHCLFKYYPKKFDYISVPTGCVHAIGPHLLLMEPQYILPEKQGKTWRISDWQRKYDDHGKLSPQGKPRELHTKQAIEAIDWSLPQGEKIISTLVQNLGHQERFYGNTFNPFAVQLFSHTGQAHYQPLQKESFSLVTIWSGRALLTTPQGEKVELKAGESAMISCQIKEISLTLEKYLDDNPELAFFALNEEVTHGLC